MEKLIDNTTLSQWVNELAQHPIFINDLKLTPYQIEKLLKYISERKNEINEHAEMNQRKLVRWRNKEDWPDKVQDMDQLRKNIIDDLNRVIILEATQANVEAWSHKQKKTIPLPDQQQKKTKVFTEFLKIDKKKKQLFAEKLKKEFHGIKGKELGIMLRALEAETYISIIDRQRSALYDSLRILFDWDICSNTALNRALNQYSLYKKELDYYQGKIQDIYKSIK